MSLVAVFLCFYGLMHLYMLIKLRRAFYLEGIGYIFLCIILLFLMVAPINYRVLEAQQYLVPSLLLAWVGNLWMGVLFVFVCLSLPLDAYHLLMAFLQNLLDKDLTHFVWSRRQRVTIPALLVAGIMLYGLFEAHQVRSESVVLTTAKLPPEAGRIRIVQISDVHMGPMIFAARLTPMINAIKKASPDILVSTGDLMDGLMLDPFTPAQRLRDIKAPLGKFAVSGNHEFYVGQMISAEFTKSCGFTLLSGQSAAAGPYLTIAGVDDPAGANLGPPSESRLLETLPRDRFTLLLKHRPRVDPGSIGRFDLQLSGHAHKGQIFPFALLVGLRYPVLEGLRHYADSMLYVSRGTGTWGPPIRFLAPPQITIIDITPEKAAAHPAQPQAG